MVDKPIFELGKGTFKPGPGITENGDDPSTMGHYLCVGPTKPPGEEDVQNRYSNLNFTGSPGQASAIYVALCFYLPKLGWRLEKADEWIEISPTHKEYYERTISTKQMLESTIKTGLANAAQSVADYELMSHDIRKYREILNYFEKGDEHLLRSMFIDQVDIHTDLSGQPIALRTVVARWPTIIADFLRLKEDDKDPDKIAKDYDISKAEAVILATKNRLYKQWKTMFGVAAKDRYEMLTSLVKARRKSIDEYREWLKPYIARFKMTKIGGEKPLVRSRTLKSFLDVAGFSTFTNGVRLFAWQPMRIAEHKKAAAEASVGFKAKFVIDPYDSYVRENLILDPKSGLASLYPWLRKPRKYCPKCQKYYPEDTIKCKEKKCESTNLEDRMYADEIVEKDILPNWNILMGLDPQEVYYMFLDIEISRMGIRIQTGEMEDMFFYTRIFILSQNVMLVKILEVKCRELEIERYIDEMLGVKFESRDVIDWVREEFPKMFGKEKQKLTGIQEYSKGLRETLRSYRDFADKIRLPKVGKLAFFKPGRYEADFKERITKQYLKYAAMHLGVMTQFIKEKMGVD